MFLKNKTRIYTAKQGPVGVGLIGAGKFGSMFLSQVPSSTDIRVDAIADLNPDNVNSRLSELGWPSELSKTTYLTNNVEELLTRPGVDVVVEATGDPIAGIVHAKKAIAHGKHVVMVNVEADALAGPALASLARKAGVVYSMAYGDQPALTCEMIDWAINCGFEVVAAGKGTKYLPAYHQSTPDTVWQHYGLTADQAAAAGMNSKMFNSFLDGTKSAIEMCAIANATQLDIADSGLSFPPCGADELANVLKPIEDGGQLERSGLVEVVSSLNRDASVVERDLRWGVYVVIKAPNDYSANCFTQYGMNVDSSGRYSAMYKPFHLIGLELNISILSACVLGEATGSCQRFAADVATVTKTALAAGTELDGEGGFSVFGKAVPAGYSLKNQCLPIGLAQGARLKRDIAAGEEICYQDVEVDLTHEAIVLRKSMEIQYLEKFS